MSHDDENTSSMNIAPTDRRGDNLTAAAAAAAGGSGATSSSPPPSPSSPTCSSDAAAAAALATKRRREIQSIMRDATLTDLERRLKIQQLMDGSLAAATTADSSVVGSGSDGRIGSMMSSLSIHDNNNNNNNNNSTMQNIESISSSSDGNINDGIDGDRSNNNHNHNNKSPPSQVVEVSSEQQEEVVSCIHYERKCNIVAPCCQRTFGCRLCHDEIMSHQSTLSTSTAQTNNTAINNANKTNNTTTTKCKIPMDRYAISQIVCKACHTLQSSKTNTCHHCQISFAEYHCATCNIWMSNTQSPFHCSKCGMCRVGGKENYKHCDLCGMCLSIVVFESHHCMPDKYKNSCPVCREDMFSSRLPPQELPCGHAIHSHCYRNLATFDNRCPICKKTVVSRSSMMEAWMARARDIELQPMPLDLARVVNIVCNDCETKSANCHWHFLGVQCPNCRSFNTVVEGVVSSSSG
ncbi:hypothetical protein ACHAWU_000026 [Discostella pseudostelligera]|uniref:Uncharacterized protein n=1 Tax=Discostella pseudostelligera TaxID=259834 RepID=A0ABD3MD42_9STRA